MYLRKLAYLEVKSGKCSWSARFLFERQKVVIADHDDRQRWERYFEPWDIIVWTVSENEDQMQAVFFNN